MERVNIALMKRVGIVLGVTTFSLAIFLGHVGGASAQAVRSYSVAVVSDMTYEAAEFLTALCNGGVKGRLQVYSSLQALASAVRNGEVDMGLFPATANPGEHDLRNTGIPPDWEVVHIVAARAHATDLKSLRGKKISVGSTVGSTIPSQRHKEILDAAGVPCGQSGTSCGTWFPDYVPANKLDQGTIHAFFLSAGSSSVPIPAIRTLISEWQRFILLEVEPSVIMKLRDRNPKYVAVAIASELYSSANKVGKSTIFTAGVVTTWPTVSTKTMGEKDVAQVATALSAARIARGEISAESMQQLRDAVDKTFGLHPIARRQK